MRDRGLVYAFVGLAVGGVVACSSPTYVCTADLRLGISVSVVDSLTGLPPDTATFVARAFAYVDSVGPIASNGGPLGFGAAPERTGTYDLRVRSPRYVDWVRTGVTVKQNGCHVTQQSFIARLVKR